MRTPARILTVAAGYLAALSLAIGGIVAFRYLNPPTDPNDSMRDFGDMFLFCGMFGLFALAPTGLAFYFLRRVGWFWYIAAAFALALNGLGILAELTMARPAPGTLDALAGFGTLTILGSPLLALGFLLGAFVTTIPTARKTLFAAAALEFLLLAIYIAYVLRSLR